MATIYIDFEEGNNDYSGTSFNVLASGTDGRISSSTFSSSSANFPNDGSLLDQYLSIFNGTSYLIYNITAYLSSTSLTIARLSATDPGSALADQTVDRQYYIGGRWANFTNINTSPSRKSTGDTIRIKASPPPTSLGVDTTWTSSTLASAVNIVSSTNASPIEVTANSHGYSTGDTIVITGHTTNTNANGTWEITVTGTNTFTLDNSTGNGVGGASGTTRSINNRVIRLASSLTQNIASVGNRGEGRTAWTNATNVTTTLNTTDFKQGDCSDSIDVLSAFTTGLLAYKSLGSTLDLSSYQQVSFWFRQNTGNIATSGNLSLRLCSDPSGVTAVNTLSIESPITTSRWFPVTINNNAPLGSGIQSVALYLSSDQGAQTFLISNIIACKASSSDNSLTLQSLIGKNTANEPWCPIQSIDGTRVIIDQSNNIAANSSDNRGYFGTSETVTGYKRETYKTIMASTGAATNGLVMANVGNRSYNNIIQGGYDRTDMSSVVDYTFFDGRNNFGRFASIAPFGFNVTLKNFGIVRYSVGFYTSLGNIGPDRSFYDTLQLYANSIGIHLDGNTVGCNITNILSYFDNNIIRIASSSSHSISGVYGGCTATSLSVGGGASDNGAIRLINAARISIENLTLFNNSNALYVQGANNSTIANSLLSFNTYGSLNQSLINTEFKNCTFENNSIGSIKETSNLGATLFNKCVFNDSLEFDFSTAQYLDTGIYSQNHDNTSNYHLNTFFQGIISSVTDVRYSDSGISWRFAPTTRTASHYPLILDLAKVAVSANGLVTVTAWMRRNNTALNLGLRVKGGQISGVPSDITSFMSASANTWEQVTLTFTPTEAGVVTIEGICTSGDTRLGYIDDISITQA